MQRERARQLPRKILWFVLGFGVILYLLILGYTYIRWDNDEPKTTEENTPTPDGAQAAEASLPDSECDIESLMSMSVNARQSLAAAESLINKRQYHRAAEMLATATQDNPHNLAMKLCFARARTGEKKYIEAQILLNEVLSSEPDQKDARLVLARVLLQQKDYQSAILAAKWALEKDDYSLAALNILAASYTQIDEPLTAITYLQRIARLDRNNVATLNKLAMAYSDISQHDRAIRLLRDKLATSASEATTYYNLAVCYARKQAIEEAIDVLSQASIQFGGSFVDSWLKTSEFDVFRTDPAFEKLQNEINGSPPTSNEQD